MKRYLITFEIKSQGLWPIKSGKYFSTELRSEEKIKAAITQRLAKEYSCLPCQIEIIKMQRV